MILEIEVNFEFQEDRDFFLERELFFESEREFSLEFERELILELFREFFLELEREFSFELEINKENEELELIVILVNSVINIEFDSKYVVRYCYIIKWLDFQGYGFNFYVERDRLGQFIGIIDDGFFVQAVGLQEGDRIIEVNGVNIEFEFYK